MPTVRASVGSPSLKSSDFHAGIPLQAGVSKPTIVVCSSCIAIVPLLLLSFSNEEGKEDEDHA